MNPKPHGVEGEEGGREDSEVEDNPGRGHQGVGGGGVESYPDNLNCYGEGGGVKSSQDDLTPNGGGVGVE